jgi:hypothetical protein
MAKPVAEDPDLKHSEEVDSAWSPTKLTGLGIVTLGIALTIIVFMATRLTTCMYLDGSH